MKHIKLYENFNKVNESDQGLLDYLNDHYNMTRGLGEWYEGDNDDEDADNSAIIANSIDELEMGQQEIMDVTNDYYQSKGKK